MNPKMSISLHQFLTRFIIVAVYVAVMAGSWDTWWHVAVGRDTIFIPPHILLYTSASVAIISGIYGWYRTREKIWRRLAVILAIIPLSAPFDNIWHSFFGVENLSTPLLIWALPHVALVVAAIIALMLLLTLIRRDNNISAHLFGSIAFAAILILLLFLALPLRPLGPYELIGFYGAGIFSALYIGTILVAESWLPNLGGASLVTAFALIIYTMGMDFANKVASGVVMNPYAPPPPWLTIIAFLATAVFIDVVKRPPPWVRGAIAGILLGGILYSFSSPFLEPTFQYTIEESVVALSTSFLGGIVVGFLLQYISRRIGLFAK